jgi:hypothetical protein
MTVIDLERVHVDRLAADVAPVLASNGVVRAHIDDIVSVERWRRAARSAARSIGSRVRTGTSGEWVWAVSEDWQPGPGADRKAARLFSALIGPSGFP